MGRRSRGILFGGHPRRRAISALACPLACARVEALSGVARVFARAPAGTRNPELAMRATVFALSLTTILGFSTVSAQTPVKPRARDLGLSAKIGGTPGT